MRRYLCFFLAILVTGSLALGQEESLTIDAETAGICGFRHLWDTPVVTAPDGVRTITDEKVTDRGGAAPWNPEAREEGSLPAALAFDAMHRALLVRFPGAYEQIAERLAAGKQIQKVELVLPFADEELWPWGASNWAPLTGGYLYRANWGVDKQYRTKRPTWHAVAQPLRRPWIADAELGPTWNAHINGAGYWSRFGAQDEGDRFAQRFGPTPVNYEEPEGRMDVTAFVTGGSDLAGRLDLLERAGFRVQKWETYDHRYFDGVYEWATATGGRAIIIEQPKLVVTFADGPAVALERPPMATVRQLAEQLRASGNGGAPTAVIPSREELKELDRRFGVSQPGWMPGWQYEHVQELLSFSYGEGASEAPWWIKYVLNHVQGWYRQRLQEKGSTPADGWVYEGLDPEYQYWAWVDDTIGKQYRGWHGFEAARVFLPWFVYQEAMPGPMRQWYEDYWTAWLMPERETSEELFPPIPEQKDGKLIHPMYDQLAKNTGTATQLEGDSYYATTGDWRGNKSFYRSGFNYTISTTNFNNTASMGALLGGAIIDGERPIADGRHGQANFPLKLWTWHDGSTQEEIDDYYFGVTVKAQKMIRDFGPTLMDQLIGASQLLKSMTMLVEGYHPGLRRYVSGASRTAPHYRMGTQEGLYGVLHTLSKAGTYTDLEDPKAVPYEKFGREFPPSEVAQQAAISPFAPLWYEQIIDHKPLPFSLTASFKQWGAHDAHPIMRRTWLAENYGIFTTNAHVGNVPLIAHWRRAEEVPTLSSQVGTLWLRNGINDTFWGNNAPGWRETYGEAPTLHHDNVFISITSPGRLQKHKEVRSIQSSIALFNSEAQPGWELFVDGKAVTPPLDIEAEQRITLRDGATWIGIIPLPATDLGRDSEVRIAAGTEQVYYEKYTIRPALVIDNFYRQKPGPLDAEATDWAEVNHASGGFVVEFAERGDFPSFEAFQQHLAEAKVSISRTPAEHLVEVSYQSGDDLLEMGAYTAWNDRDSSLDNLFAYQRINGEYAYLPKGVERDSNVSVQATSGTLTKHGATLKVDEGRLAVLQVEPNSGATLAATPLAELTAFSLTGPEGFEITADGRVGLTIATWDPANRDLDIQHGLLPSQQTADGLASAMMVAASGKGAVIKLNGEPAANTHSVSLADGRRAVLVPLDGEPVDVEAVMQRLARP